MQKFTEEAKLRRHHKVVEVLKAEIYEIFRREVKDPRAKSLTITQVDLKPDLKSATIYVCKFVQGDGHEPTEEEREDLMEGLKSASRFIYESLKRRLSMKVIPTIRFSYDIGLSGGSQMWGLLRKIEDQRTEAS